VTDDLEVLDPAPVEVVYRGERLEIRPLELIQISAVVRKAKPLLDRLLDADIDSDAGLTDFLMAALADDLPQVIEVAAVITGKTAHWMGKGTAADLLRLGQAVFEVNRDFFAQLPEQLRGEWTGRAAKSRTGDGSMPSNSSSSVGTG
jgi:hypothetical protein